MAIAVGTNSYITEAELTTYGLDRGITITGDLSILLIKAMDYIETRRYTYSKYDSAQPLQFPRSNGDGTVPSDIKKAQCIASILIGQGYDLQPVIDRETKSEKVGALEIVYKDNSEASAHFTALTDILRLYTTSSSVIQLVRV